MSDQLSIDLGIVAPKTYPVVKDDPRPCKYCETPGHWLDFDQDGLFICPRCIARMERK